MNERIRTTKDLGRPAHAARDAGRLGSGVALAALAAAMPGSRVLAHEATPAAGEGSVRPLHGDPDQEGQSRPLGRGADRAGRSGLRAADQELPGFVSYVILWNAETRDWVSIGTFTDKSAADESTATAADFGISSGTRDYVEGDPIVVEGVVVLAAGEGG